MAATLVFFSVLEPKANEEGVAVLVVERNLLGDFFDSVFSVESLGLEPKENLEVEDSFLSAAEEERAADAEPNVDFLPLPKPAVVVSVLRDSTVSDPVVDMVEAISTASEAFLEVAE